MKSKLHYTRAEANEIIALIEEKLKADPTRQKGIRAKIRSRGFFASDFGFRDGYTVMQFLNVVKLVGGIGNENQTTLSKVAGASQTTPVSVSSRRGHSDESYVIDLCDEVLGQKAFRQHRFDFLVGDSGTKLPVDGFYPNLNLVVEYRERQHTETVKFFDKRDTVSGVGRGEQRKLYDQRRRDVLPKHGLRLIELDYSDFNHSKGKKLIRNSEEDLRVIIKKLKK